MRNRSTTILRLLATGCLAALLPLAYAQQPQPGNKPGSQQGNNRPGGRPGGNQSGAKPGARPSPQPGNRPGGQPGNKPAPKPGNRPAPKPNPPQNQHRPGNSGARPNPGGRPNPGNRPPAHRPPAQHKPPARRPPQWGRPPAHRQSYNFRPDDRNRLRSYYSSRFGLINRARRPIFRMGGYFPYGDINYLSPLPPNLYGYMPPPPPGYQMGYYDGYVVVYDPMTYFIANVIDLLQ